MRSHPLRRLIPPRGRRLRAAALIAGVLCAGSLALPSRGEGDAPPVGVEILLTLPESLHVGDRAALTADVRIAPVGPHPVLVTPSSEGSAIEVVRGRLLRADAEDPEAETLRFRIPIVARAPGDAVLRVEVQGHACTPRCVAVRDEARVVARVQRR